MVECITMRKEPKERQPKLVWFYCPICGEKKIEAVDFAVIYDKCCGKKDRKLTTKKPIVNNA